MNFDDIFANFFGGGRGRGGPGGGGSHFHFNMGGGGFNQHHQKQRFEQENIKPPPEQIPDLFENTDVIGLDLSGMSTFYRRQEIWIIYFFNPKLEECKAFKEEYVNISDRLYSIIKVGAIDCLNEEELCEEFSVYQVPSILIFSENFADDGEKYTGEMDAASIMNAAAKKMQSFVSVVSEDNYDSFVERDRTSKHKIILFNAKKSTPTVIKALSKRYLDRLTFGEIKQNEEELVRKFGIESFPTILALTDPENYRGEKYEGEMNIEQLTKFIANYAYSTPKKPEITEFIELTEKKMNNKSNSLCGPKSSNICVIIFTDGANKLASQAQLDQLKSVISFF